MNALSSLFYLTDKSVSQSQETALSVHEMTVGYGALPIVSDASFSVPSGSRFAIIGPNGAGKSTLLKGMLGLLQPTGGKAEFLGRPFAAVRQHVAYVTQADEIDWHFPSTVGDLVGMGRAVHLGLAGRLGPRDWEAVERAMVALNIEDLVKRPLSDLSGGQRRRVLLARALAQDPQMLILDEPFQAIDAATRNALLKALDVFRDQGKTAVIVHHNLTDVRNLFDGVALINKTVTATGTSEAVLGSKAFFDAFGQATQRAA